MASSVTGWWPTRYGKHEISDTDADGGHQDHKMQWNLSPCLIYIVASAMKDSVLVMNFKFLAGGLCPYHVFNKTPSHKDI
jgi:hypothetical protein